MVVKIWEEKCGSGSLDPEAGTRLLEEVDTDFVTSIIEAQRKYPDKSICVRDDKTGFGFTPLTGLLKEEEIRKYLTPAKYTELQEAKLNELETQGWQVVSCPEEQFNMASMVEDPEGVTHFVKTDGTVGKTYK